MASVPSNPAHPPSHPKFTVAICGGGIAGLTLAVALQKMSAGDIRIDIYEAAREYTEIGVGVGLLKRPWKVLKQLGLAEDMAKIAPVPQDEHSLKLLFDIRKSDQAEGVRYYEMLAPFGILAFHRADFQNVLSSHLEAAVTTSHFSKRLAYYDTPPPSDPAGPEGIRLHFEDGSSATCDVLVGADGIKSPSRRCLLTQAASDIAKSNRGSAEQLLSKIDPVWSGSITYRGVIPSENLEKINPEHKCLKECQLYTGKDKHVTSYPITHGGKKLVNVAAVCSWPEKEHTESTEDMVVRPGDKEEIQAQFAGWEPEVLQLLECLDTVTRWPINVLVPLPISVHGRVAIMGDAAHAMMPYQASGAGQAIEDAYVLAGVLAHPKTTLATVPDALKAYEAVRLKHANDVHSRSRTNGQLGHFDPEAVQAAMQDWASGAIDNPEGTPTGHGSLSITTNGQIDITKLKNIGTAMFEGWKWSWTTDVQDDLSRALGALVAT